MNRLATSRRGRTRWLMIVPITGLALIILGVVGLEGIAPKEPPTGRSISDVPDLAMDEARSCVRGSDDGVVEEIRARFEPGDRVSSTQVYLCPSAFDASGVTFVGEVVGDLLKRPGGAWVQVNDDEYALEVGPLIDHRAQMGFNRGLSVWLPDGLHERIEGLGDATARGDVVRIRGTLLRADPEDGEGLTLRAQELEVIAPTLPIDPPFHRVQAIVAGVLALLALVSVAWARAVRQR